MVRASPLFTEEKTYSLTDFGFFLELLLASEVLIYETVKDTE